MHEKVNYFKVMLKRVILARIEWKKKSQALKIKNISDVFVQK